MAGCDFRFWPFSDMASVMCDVRLQGQSRHNLEAPALPLMTQSDIWLLTLPYRKHSFQRQPLC
jgi:hypothetical protein